MNTKEYYRKVISNPYSWKYVSEDLFTAAKDLCDIYKERREGERDYFMKRLETGNKLFKAKLKKSETELDQLGSGIESAICKYTPVTALGEIASCDDLYLNLKSYLHLLPIYMMLMGMAVEDLAKGITVARKLKEDNTIVDRATLKLLGVYGHSAPDLIEHLGIYLKDNEKKLLLDINEHLEWSGRYSAPSNENKLVLSETVWTMTPVEFDEEKVFEVLAGLYMQLLDIFDKEVEDPLIRDLPWLYCFHFR